MKRSLKNKHMKKLFILITATLMFSTTIFSQSVSQKLLQQKAKELGVSEAVAEKKAAEMGYDVTSSGGDNAEKAATETPSPTTEKVRSVTKSISNYGVTGFGGNAFGYNIFNYKPKTFEPGLNVPVPKNYVLGPGDEIIISLWGETQLVNNYVVSKEGTIYIQSSGMININGLTLNEVKDKLFKILSKTYATLASEIADDKTYMEITTGTLRTVKIFCLGEIVQPGGYSLPSLSTVFTSLYFSGGPKINGSLRNIKVIREGKEIVKMDLYKYILSGIKSDDISLQEGDVIFVPRVGKRVEISGNTFKPAVYELFPNETLSDLIKYNGGINFNTYTKRISIDRLIPFAERKLHIKNKITINLDFSSKEELLNNNFKLEDGDIVKLSSVNNIFENRVSIQGEVEKPGIFELTSGMRVSDLIGKADSVKDDVYMEEALLVRTYLNGKQEMFTFNVEKALSGDSTHNMVLEDRDEIKIFNIEKYIPTGSVKISGPMVSPGIYTRMENMKISDLITISGPLLSDVFLEEALLIRTYPNGKEEVLKINLGEVLSDNENSNLLLEDRDEIQIYSHEKYFPTRSVEIAGQINSPGSYTRRENMKLEDLITLAGGFTYFADLNTIEVSQLDTTRIDTFYNTFTLKINPDYWSSENTDDYLLQDYDKVSIKRNPKIQNKAFISVTGEVKYPGSYSILQEGDRISDFIERAGGLLNSAYLDGMYINRANKYQVSFDEGYKRMADSLTLMQGRTVDGTIISKQFMSQFSTMIPIDWELIKDGDNSYDYELLPGDQIVIPINKYVVYVMGEVGIQSSIPYKEGADLDYYIRQAGGYTLNSVDGDEIIILPNGKKAEMGGWFSSDDEILSGSKIFVPMEIKAQQSSWYYIRTISTVVSSTAIVILTYMSIAK